MIRWSYLIVTLFLSACSSVKTIQYQLPNHSHAIVTDINPICAKQKSILWIKGITVSDYLASNGMVYQTSDVNYIITNHNIWVSPLHSQLQQLLVDSLQTKLPCYIVTTSPLSIDNDMLSITVTNFNGRFDGHVVIRGTWLLRHQDKLQQQSFNLIIEQQQAGYASMVTTLANGWQQVIDQIIQQITKKQMFY